MTSIESVNVPLMSMMPLLAVNENGKDEEFEKIYNETILHFPVICCLSSAARPRYRGHSHPSLSIYTNMTSMEVDNHAAEPAKKEEDPSAYYWNSYSHFGESLRHHFSIMMILTCQ